MSADSPNGQKPLQQQSAVGGSSSSSSFNSTNDPRWSSTAATAAAASTTASRNAQPPPTSPPGNSSRFDLVSPPSGMTPFPSGLHHSVFATPARGAAQGPAVATQPAYGRHDMLPPPPQSQNTADAWSFPEHLQPSSSIPDGDAFNHLPQPFAAGTDHLAGVAPLGALQQQHQQQSKPIGGGSRASRKKDKGNEPQSLEELKDPLPGQKPDYPYPTLIRCAILSHGKRSPTLSEIYDMIHKRFSFFKMDDASWKNSVRHYLSISPSFVKLPRPITEPGKGNYWTYDANPENRAPRRKPRQKVKRERDDDVGGLRGGLGGSGMDDYDRPSGREHRLPRHSPPPPSNGRYHTPSSSDTADVLRAGGLSSLGARDRGIASRQKSPAHGWLEARDTLGSPPKQSQPTLPAQTQGAHRESLPTAQSLFGDIARAPVHLPTTHHSISASGPGGVSSVSSYASSADDAFNVPQSPYPPATRNGSGAVPAGSAATGSNGPAAGLDFGGPQSVYNRDQFRPGSSAATYSQSLPPLGESFFSSINADRRSSRHGDDSGQLLPSLTTTTGANGGGGGYNSVRGSSLVRNDSMGSQQQASYRFDSQPLAPPPSAHWS